MTAALVPATALLFGFAGVGAVGVIVGTIAPEWRRIVQLLRNEKTPTDHWSTGASSLSHIAGRRWGKGSRSFPSQARRGALRITVSHRGETPSYPAPASVMQ